MSVLFLQTSGPAPPELCWERYAVPANWSQWAPQIRAVTVDGARAPGAAPARRPGGLGSVGVRSGGVRSGGAGSRVAGGPAEAGRIRIQPGLRGRVRSLVPLAACFVVTAVDEIDRTWSWRVGVGPVCLTLDHGVDACLDGGTSTWLRITGPGPVLYACAPLARAALRRLVR